MKTAYTIRDLTHRYDRETVLEIPHLELPAGGITAIYGPNGAGKSTLLHILALLQRPWAGSIHLLGEPVDFQNTGTLNRQVTLIHQKPVLFSTTVQNNVAYGLRARRSTATEIEKKVGRALADVGLSGFEHRAARKLSGGEAQRVVLARAIVLDTPILLLDEPSSFLDASFKPRVIELLRRENRQRRRTILFASHNRGFVDALADECLLINGGRIASENGG